MRTFDAVVATAVVTFAFSYWLFYDPDKEKPQHWELRTVSNTVIKMKRENGDAYVLRGGKWHSVETYYPELEETAAQKIQAQQKAQNLQPQPL